MAVSNSSRRSARSGAAALPEPTLVGRVAWLLAAAGWVFFAISFIGFDLADWPSSAVALHNLPSANFGGDVGAGLAWWSFSALGFGAWLVLAFGAIALYVRFTGHRINHPIVRSLGVVLAGIAVGSLQHAWAPTVGHVPGATAGLVPSELEFAFSGRFGGLGTSLILLTMLILGLLVAADELVLAAPAAILRMLKKMRAIDRAPAHAALSAIGAAGGKFLPSRRAMPQLAGGVQVEEEEEEDEDDYEYVDEYEDEDEEEYEEEDEEPPRPATPEELRAKIARLPLRMGGGQTEVARDEDIPRNESFEGYQFPTLDLLDEPEGNYGEAMETHVRDQAGRLEESLHTFQIAAEVVGIESGPVVTLYSVLLAPGTRVARLNAIASDIARSLQAQNVRIIANMAGKSTVGIEVPNPGKEKVRLKELMSTGQADSMRLPMFLGKDASGEPLVYDLARMPHMLIAGTTGSGKSVCLNTIIMSWLYTKRPDEVKLVLVDPKMVEMNQFADIPHLMCPIVTETHRAVAILEWAVGKMEERYELFREAGVRDIATYNDLTDEELKEIFEPADEVEWAKIPKKLPYLVFVIDELADLMMTAKEVEHSIVRIAQKARAVGLHLIVATQRPQANVVTGLIKSNMPCRVSFKVASGMDSRIVLDQKGAELLLGQGDMMVVTPDSTQIRRCQGTLVTDRETRAVAKFLRTVAAPTFERSLMAVRPKTKGSSGGSGHEDECDGPNERDPLFDKSVEIMIESGRGSVSLLQRRLAIGYSRASRLVDQMGLAGILGEHKGSVAREVQITLEDWKRMKAIEDGDEGYAADEPDDGDVPAEMSGEYLG